jgi:predicted GH43/DUF377 family glycosyl hydrolase
MNTFQQKIFATICAIVIILPLLSIDQITSANNNDAPKIPLLRGDVEGLISNVEDKNNVEQPLNSQPDLTVISIDRSLLSTDNQILTISGTISADIENQGDAATATNFDIAFFEDSNGNGAYEGSDNLLGSTTYSGVLDPGVYTTVSASVSGSVLFRDNLIYTFVDSGNVIVENDETNNLRNTGQDCEYRPPTGVFNPVLEWAWTGSSIESEWNQVMCAPAVGNLNDDNGDGKVDDNDIPDIIFNTWKIATGYWKRGRLRAISGDGSGELFTITSHWTAPGCSPAIGDIDKDGLPEIIVLEELTSVGATITYLLVFENDGTLKWKTSSNYDFGYYGHIAGPSIADLDEDGTPEIIIGNYAFNNDGTLRWHGTGSSGLHISTIANLDMAGHPEVVAGNIAYYFDGTIYWQNAIVPEGRPAVGNFDDDAYPEVVVVGNGNISMLEHDGTLKWGPFDIEPPGTYRDFGGPPTIADFDGDGHVEIGVAGGYRYVVYEGNGTVMWSNTTVDYSSSQTGSSVFDFEGDGSAEVVYADEEYLRIYKGSNGEVLWEYLLGSGTLLELPLIVDVYNDNNAEIVMICNDYVYWSNNTGVYIFGDANDNWVNTRKIWNQHAYHITNVYDNATIPQYEQKNNWKIYNNFRCQAMAAGTFAAPDLSSCYIKIDDTSYPTSIDITARIGNGGAISVTAGVSIAFYDGDPSAGGTLLGIIPTSVTLVPGQYEDVTLTWLSPVSGYHDFYVVADDDGTGQGSVSECCELNNIWHFATIIGRKPPIANAGDDQTVNEGDIVQFDGSNSKGSTSGEGQVWTKYVGNPVLDIGPSGSWDDAYVTHPSVLYDGATYHMWYSGYDSSNWRIGYAQSSDGITWVKNPSNPIIDVGASGSWDDTHVTHPIVLYDGTKYHMWYSGHDGWTYRIGYASSSDGITWVKYSGNPVLDCGPSGSWEDTHVTHPTVLYDGTKYHMWYTGHDGSHYRIGYAYSSDGTNWFKSTANPVLNLGSSGSWDDFHVYGPSIIYDGITYSMWYSGHDGSNWRIGYATSSDGITWTRDASNPVLDIGPPGSWEDVGVHSPTVLFSGGFYHMWYRGFSGTNVRIGYAYSSTGGEAQIVSYEWDFNANVDSDGDGNSTNDVDATGPTPIHIYGDNGVFIVTLKVTDDQNLTDTDTCNITVLNVDPTVIIESATMNVEISLRVAGSKWSNVGLTLYENDTEMGYLEVERWPGNPNDNPTYENPALPTTLDMTKNYRAIVTYDPYPDNNDEIKGDQPNNGKDKQNNAGNPVWIIMKFSDGREEKIHHTFNTQQSKKKDSKHWNHVEPWEVDLTGHLVGHEFEVTSHITDPGSDDEILTFTYGSQVVSVTLLNNPPNPDPYPSPEVNIQNITDTTTLTYEGPGNISLLVEDDDGGTATASINLG